MSLRDAAAAPGDVEIISEVREFFQRYGATFVALATGRRSDVGALLEFYGAPLRYIGSTFHIIMQDEVEITGADGMGGEIDRLRHAGFAGSALERCQISVLNRRAALIDALWLRRDAAGAAMARFVLVYLLTLTPDGWRITSAIDTSD